MKKNIIYVDFIKKRKISHFHYLINRFIYYLNDELKIIQKAPKDTNMTKKDQHLARKYY